MVPRNAITGGRNMAVPSPVPVGCELEPVTDGSLMADMTNENAPTAASSGPADGCRLTVATTCMAPWTTKGAAATVQATAWAGGRNPSAICIFRMCLSAQHLVGIDIGAVVGLLAHGSSGSPRGRSATPKSTFPPARRASSGMQDADFPFTVARAAPVLHRVPVHRSRRSITSTRSAWSLRQVRFRSGRTSARQSTAATRPRSGCDIRASSTAG